MVIALAISLGVSGCATKKFVLGKLNPLGGRVDKLEDTTSKTSEEVAENRTAASRAEEVARSAQTKADAAGSEAARANRQAGDAADAAAGAGALAQRNENALGELDDKVAKLNTTAELLTSETVLFKFESSKLQDDAKATLDAAVQQAEANSPYVFEVRGFTDTTGSTAYNQALSSSRANAVVRYLTLERNVPLHRIHMLGMGSESPAADNKTRDGRELNRRVEVKLYNLKLATNAPTTARNY